MSKIDLVDTGTRRRAADECAALAPDLPLVEISSRTSEGVEDLRMALARLATDADDPGRESETRPDAVEPVLHVDRAFTVAGHGTVVTGTLWSGQLERGQRVVLLPGGREARVRALQVHDRSRNVADSHQRVALNLAGLARDEVHRGDVITTWEAGVQVTYRLDIELLADTAGIPDESRVQVHLGTRDSPARVVDLEDDRVQLRLERQLLARAGDRLVIRRIAPPDTLGGGIVEDPAPPRHGASWRPLPEKDEEASAAPMTPVPAEPGQFALRVLAALTADGDRPRGAEQLAASLSADRRTVEVAYGELAATGEVVRAKADVVFATPAYEKMARLALALAERDGSTSIAAVRDTLGLSRKYAQALLEQLNSEHRLRRKGDRHYFRRQTCG